jgi:hypothetical protein
MKSQMIGKTTVAVLAAYAAVGLASIALAQPAPIQAEVRHVKGTATYSVPGGPGKPLKEGTTLIAPTSIKTGPESLVDVYLGQSAGLIRIAQNTSVSIDKLTSMETGADDVIEAQMNLPKGQMFFDVNKLSQASRYEIKVPYGVAGIRGTGGAINDGSPNPLPEFGGKSLPPVLLTEGRLIQVYNPPGGGPVAYTLTAPPSVAWSPTGGVQPAPPDDVRFTTGQIEEARRATRGEVPQAPPVPQAEPVVSSTAVGPGGSANSGGGK